MEIKNIYGIKFYSIFFGNYKQVGPENQYLW